MAFQQVSDDSSTSTDDYNPLLRRLKSQDFDRLLTPCLYPVLREATAGTIAYILPRWIMHQGTHHRVPLSEAVVHAELYHQLRIREQQGRLGQAQFSVETPLNTLPDKGRADIFFCCRVQSNGRYWTNMVHIEVKTAFDAAPRAQSKEPPKTADIVADIYRLATAKCIGIFILMGERRLVDTVLRRVPCLTDSLVPGECLVDIRKTKIPEPDDSDCAEDEDYLHKIGTRLVFSETYGVNKELKTIVLHVVGWKGDGWEFW